MMTCSRRPVRPIRPLRGGDSKGPRAAKWPFLLGMVVAGLTHTDAAQGDTSSGWAAGFATVRADVAAGRPFVAVVVVPLCDNDQIACGSGGLGNPASGRVNLYWGALYGAKRFFDRPDSGFERVDTAPLAPTGPWLDRAVYRRWVPGAAWHVGDRQVEQLVALQAAHGARIDSAVDHFWSIATGGGTVDFRDGARDRQERVHVAGYAGHNRLMDGKRLPAAPARSSSTPISLFVFACLSDRFFSTPLRAAGSLPLVTTRAFIAPEGYAVHAAVSSLGDNASLEGVRTRVVFAYAKWQRIPTPTASRLFAPTPTDETLR